MTYFPDSRLLLIEGPELYVADKDGLDPRPHVTLSSNAWLPSISPDGKRIVVTTDPFGKGH
jgi:Tol biopolymer transport system component